MTEQTKKKSARRPLRVGLIAAALCTLLVISVSAANPEVLEGIVSTIRSSIAIGEYRQDMTLDTGERVIGLSYPEVNLEEREGRVLLTVDGQETDITDELNEKGSYLWEYEDEGACVQVEVTLNEEGKPEAVTSIVPAGTEMGECEVSMVTESVVTTTEE
ncbi:hypothetical protein [Flavonifractor hominis]|uniref:Uncharacterized protein n=1 Tax=Flavonifractor hominis TaxID=3133178 RepID=A0ABV1ENP1_9FIRM